MPGYPVPPVPPLMVVEGEEASVLVGIIVEVSRVVEGLAVPGIHCE